MSCLPACQYNRERGHKRKHTDHNGKLEGGEKGHDRSMHLHKEDDGDSGL